MIMAQASLGTWRGALRMWVLFVAVVIFVFFSSMAAAEGKTIRIDTHAHYVPPFYYDLMVSRGLTAGGLEPPNWNVEEHLAFMDSMSIELSILSVSTPGAKLTPFDSMEDGRKLARQLNEYAHMLTKTYPERFQFFATLTLPDVEGSIAEAIYALDTLKAAGVVLLANSHGEYLGSKNFDPLMEVLNERGATVFIHPSTLDLKPVTNEVGGGQVELPQYLLDFLLDTTRAAANLVSMTVLRRYPNIKFLLSHSGGFLPFAAYRIRGAMSTLKHITKPPQSIIKELQKFYVDIAISSSPSALPSTLAFVPNHQITYGSDYPYCPTWGIIDTLKSFDEYALDDEKRHQINFHSAKGLIEKPLQHWRSTWHQDAAIQLR